LARMKDLQEPEKNRSEVVVGENVYEYDGDIAFWSNGLFHQAEQNMQDLLRRAAQNESDMNLENMRMDLSHLEQIEHQLNECQQLAANEFYLCGMIQNMAVSCSRGGTGFMGYPNIVRCMNFVLDKNLTQTDYALIGEKAWNMEKVFNVMNGFRKEDDQLPDRVFDDALTWGPMAGSHMDRDAWAVEWNKYYEQRGWDTETSAPTEGKLQELGLDELIPYLRKALA